MREAWQDFCYEEQNSEAISRYRPQPYAGHVTLFRATDQALSRNKVIDPTLGWREMVTGELEIYQVSGTHLGMLSDPNAETIGMTLRDCIRRALG